MTQHPDAGNPTGHPPGPIERATTPEGLPLTTSMGPLLESAHVEDHTTLLDSRSVLISAVCMAIAIVAGFIAKFLVALIGLITNICFYGRFSFDFSSPADNHLGLWVMAVPVLGGVIVGLMARWGSPASRAPGLPEAMGQVLTNERKIPAALT